MAKKEHPVHGRFGAVSLVEAELLLRSVDETRMLAPWIVEIGTFQGRTACFLARYCAKRGYANRVLSVDTVPQVAVPQDELDVLGDRVVFFHGTSSDVDTSIVPCMVFIDGCHCTECCGADIAAWRARVSVGGHMVFHDTYHEGKVQKYFVHAARTYGVRAAIDAAKLDEYELLCESDDPRPNMRVYRRIA